MYFFMHSQVDEPVERKGGITNPGKPIIPVFGPLRRSGNEVVAAAAMAPPGS